MAQHRILVFGNSGSGKTTLSQQLSSRLKIAHLDLDDIAWGANVEDVGARLPISDSKKQLDAFLSQHHSWVIEGCYGDLLEHCTSSCTEMHFLNLSVEQCIANTRTRPREHEMTNSTDEYNDLVAELIAWIQQYETRDAEYSYVRHHAIFDGFEGSKREYTSSPVLEQDHHD